MTLRIGMIYPAAGRSEKEFEKLAPEGVEVHVTRISFTSEEISQLLEMENHLEDAADLLSQAGVDLILFNCTTGSLVRGHGYDKKLIDKMEAKTGIPSMTTATGVLMALEHLGAKKISLVTAYPKMITEMEVKYLRDNGIEVIKSLGANITDPFEQALRKPSFWYDYSLDNFAGNSDGLFISCAGIRVVEIISDLEKKLGVTMITSNQAAMWACLKKMKSTAKVQGFGRLLSS
jgi:maleate isomerase